jgi:hypothetical protein
LGARVNGIHEVAGSIPASSTNSKPLIPDGQKSIPKPSLEPLAGK